MIKGTNIKGADNPSFGRVNAFAKAFTGNKLPPERKKTSQVCLSASVRAWIPI